MPGQHSPGYNVAYNAAIREAARRWQNGEAGSPELWRQLVAEFVARNEKR
jgi:hypothetical protein